MNRKLLMMFSSIPRQPFPIISVVLIALALAGCTTPPVSTAAPESTFTLALPTATITPTPSFTPQPTLTPTTTPISLISSVTGICSPLSGIELGDLHSIISQGFKSPTAFQDDGHPAVDLAFFTFQGLPSMLGIPVQSILPGKVVMVIEDRFPYGSMILVETPLEWFSEGILPLNSVPTPIPAENIELFNPCESDPLYESMAQVQMSTESRSLYVLYSHLLEEPAFEAGEMVSCGEIIGAVGLTGNTVAEHLHLEVRIGPSDARFNTFAMYQPDATVEERYNYCTWSTSGRFQPIDPTLFWESHQ